MRSSRETWVPVYLQFDPSERQLAQKVAEKLRRTHLIRKVERRSAATMSRCTAEEMLWGRIGIVFLLPEEPRTTPANIEEKAETISRAVIERLEAIRRVYRESIKNPRKPFLITDEAKSQIDAYLRKPKPAEIKIEDMKEFFPPDLISKLAFEDSDQYIAARPRSRLYQESFIKAALITKELNGAYIPNGSESHFRIPKRQAPDDRRIDQSKASLAKRLT